MKGINLRSIVLKFLNKELDRLGRKHRRVDKILMETEIELYNE